MLGQYDADQEFLTTARFYQDTELETFPMPRYRLPSSAFDIKVAITNMDPLQVILLLLLNL
jgi:hypothetical protein